MIGRLLLVSILTVPAFTWAQSASLQAPALIQGGAFEASGVVAVPESAGVLFVDDSRPRHVLWMEFSGNAVQKGRAVGVPLGLFAADLEDITWDGTWFYAVGSQSKPESAASYGLVRFAFDARTGRASGVVGVPDLAGLLRARVPELAGSSARRAGPLNIEGLTWDASSGRLLFGLREPTDGSNALVIALKIPAGPGAAFNRSALENADLSVLRIATGGAGIRGLGYDATARRVLALVGPAGEQPGRAERFRLLIWDPASSSAPVERATFPAALKPEGVARVVVGGRPRTLILCDASRYLFLD